MNEFFGMLITSLFTFCFLISLIMIISGFIGTLIHFKVYFREKNQSQYWFTLFKKGLLLFLITFFSYFTINLVFFVFCTTVFCYNNFAALNTIYFLAILFILFYPRKRKEGNQSSQIILKPNINPIQSFLRLLLQPAAIIGGFVILNILGVAGYSLWQRLEVVTWQTYTNSTYGFELKYPRDWIVYEDPSFRDSEKINIIVTSVSNKNIIGLRERSLSALQISISDKTHSSSELTHTGTDAILGHGHTFEKIMFAGYLANKAIPMTDLCGETLIENIIFNKDNYGWSVRYPIYNCIDSFDSKYSVYKNILSTFQFNE